MAERSTWQKETVIGCTAKVNYLILVPNFEILSRTQTEVFINVHHY